MDGLNLNGIIEGLTANPQMMQSIMSLIGNLKDDGTNQQQSQRDKVEDEVKKDQSAPVLSLIDGLSKNEKNDGISHSSPSASCQRKALLVALKPFMGKERREKIDFILSVLSLLEVAESLGFTNLKLDK